MIPTTASNPANPAATAHVHHGSRRFGSTAVLRGSGGVTFGFVVRVTAVGFADPAENGNRRRTPPESSGAASSRGDGRAAGPAGAFVHSARAAANARMLACRAAGSLLIAFRQTASTR